MAQKKVNYVGKTFDFSPPPFRVSFISLCIPFCGHCTEISSINFNETEIMGIFVFFFADSFPNINFCSWGVSVTGSDSLIGNGMCDY